MKTKDIGILLIVAALIGGPLQRQLRHRQDQQDLEICERNVKQLATALETYSTDCAGRYPSTLADLCPTYLANLPRCPASRDSSYQRGYQTQRPDSLDCIDAYTICCHGQNHDRIGVPPNQPEKHDNGALVWR